MKATLQSPSPLINPAAFQSVETLITQGQLKEAAQALNRLQALSPRDPRVALLGSLLAEHSGHWAGMLGMASRAHALAPQWYVATFRLAQARHRNDQSDEAVKALELALQQASGAAPAVRVDLLQKAADIAIAVGAYRQAGQWLDALVQLAPDAQVAQLQRAQLLAHSGQHEAALAIFTEVLQRSPDNGQARVGRMLCAQHLGQADLALQDAQYIEEHLAQDPIAKFHAAVQLGRRPATQPAELVRQLFDQYAHLFDQHLVRGLKYQLPQEVARLILGWYPDRKFNLLDLGCGSGLLGACLGRIEGALIGVDLSEAMIEKAARHNVYHRFHHTNLLDALSQTPSGLYQVITALDVFGYVGDLGTALPNAWRILGERGRLVFSCEAQTTGRSHYAIDPLTLRYRHARPYLLQLCQKAGFSQVEIQDIAVREEQGQAVPGFLVIATKGDPQASAPQSPTK